MATCCLRVCRSHPTNSMSWPPFRCVVVARSMEPTSNGEPFSCHQIAAPLVRVDPRGSERLAPSALKPAKPSREVFGADRVLPHAGGEGGQEALGPGP